MSRRPDVSPSLLTPDAFWRWGRLLLTSGLALSLALVLYLVRNMPEVLPLLPVVLLGGVAAWWLFRHPFLNLCVVLAGFVLIIDFEEGIQAAEVLYGLYYLGFLGWWFATRLVVYGEWEETFALPEAKALGLFLIGITLTIPLTVLFGGSLREVVSEWTALVMLAFYFPVREVCARHRHGLRWIVLILGWIGVFVAVRNMVYYQTILIATTDAFEAANKRVMINDGVLMAVALSSFVLLIFAERWRLRAALGALFLLFLAGLILTQSRTFWVAFAFGALVAYGLVGPRYRRRIVVAGVAGLFGVVAVGFAFFGDFMLLSLSYLADRFASIGTAATDDISLVNRFLETAAVWEHIKLNPVLGYGMGVSYAFYDVVFAATRDDAFIHNQYVMLWYKFGIWGLGLMLFFWGRTAWRGVRTYRATTLPPFAHAACLSAAVCLIAFFPAAAASPPFYLSDTTLLFGVLTGLVAGAYRRAERYPPATSTPS